MSAHPLEILKAAWDLGINTIDTSNNYSNDESEHVVAKFIRKVLSRSRSVPAHPGQYQIPRHQIVIASNCFSIVGNDPSMQTFLMPDLKDRREYVNQGGLSRVAIFNAVQASPMRLETTYAELLQIHRYDAEVPAEEMMKALHDLVQNGEVCYIGASWMRCWQFAHLNEVSGKNGWTTFVSVQEEHFWLYREEVCTHRIGSF